MRYGDEDSVVHLYVGGFRWPPLRRLGVASETLKPTIFKNQSIEIDSSSALNFFEGPPDSKKALFFTMKSIKCCVSEY